MEKDESPLLARKANSTKTKRRRAAPRGISLEKALGLLLTGVTVVTTVAEHQEALQKLWTLLTGS